MRANNLKNFQGISYATTVDVSTAIANLKQTGKEVFVDTLLGTKGNVNEIAMYNADGVFQSTGYTLGVISETNFGQANKLATEAGVKAYVDKIEQDIEGAALGIAAGNGIYLADGEGTVKKINAFGYKLVKRTTAESGYAATYDLQISDSTGTYTTVTGSDPINIVKDQFLKSATMVWGTSATLSDNVVVGESTSKTDTAKYPFLKMVMYTNDNGVGADDTLTTTVYIPVDELFHDYTVAANATEVQLAISGTNELSASIVTGSIAATKLATAVQTSLGLADSAIQAGDANKLTYTPVNGTATNVKDYLDTLTTNLNNIDVTADITAEIEKLDVTDTAVANEYVSSVSETDGKITVTRVALPVTSVTVDATTKELKVNGTTIATLTPAGIGADVAGAAANVLGTSGDAATANTVYGAKAAASAAQTAADNAQADVDAVTTAISGKAVQLVEKTITLTAGTTADGITVAIVEGEVTITNIPGRVVCVYDVEGKQVYPDTTYAKATGKSTLVADYGTTAVDTSWDIVYTEAITVAAN